MKTRKYTSARYVRHYPAYPNQAAPDYYRHKAMEISAGIASGIGLAATLVLFTVFM